MGNFNNQWVEIFRAGNYGDKGNWTPEKIDQVVANLEATNTQGQRLHTPMAVFGHPKHDDPAHGAVDGLKREGEILLAQFTKTSGHLEKSVQDGRFPNRSAAFYRDPQGKGPMLRHVGFLGGTPPEVKGLAPIQFFDGGEYVSIDFKEETVSNQNPEDTKRGIREAVEGFFAEMFGKKTQPAAFTEEQLQKAVAKAVQPLQEGNTKLATEFAAFRKETNERAQQQGAEAAKGKVAAFMEKLRAKNVPPAVQATLEPMLLAAAQQPGTVTFTEKDNDGKEQEVKLSPFDALCRFVETNAAIIPTGEVAAGRRKAGKVVQFTEPQNPASVDSESLALAERAEALEAEVRKENPKFTETEVARLALQRARQEQPDGAVSAGKV